MNVGLPGTGIGGLFYLLTALMMPLVELARTFAGRSSLKRWQIAMRQSLLACGVIAGLSLTSQLLGVLARTDRGANAGVQVGSQAARFLGVTPTLWTYGTLAAVLLAAEVGRAIFRPVRNQS